MEGEPIRTITRCRWRWRRLWCWWWRRAVGLGPQPGTRKPQVKVAASTNEYAEHAGIVEACEGSEAARETLEKSHGWVMVVEDHFQTEQIPLFWSVLICFVVLFRGSMSLAIPTSFRTFLPIRPFWAQLSLPLRRGGGRFDSPMVSSKDLDLNRCSIFRTDILIWTTSWNQRRIFFRVLKFGSACPGCQIWAHARVHQLLMLDLRRWPWRCWSRREPATMHLAVQTAGNDSKNRWSWGFCPFC